MKLKNTIIPILLLIGVFLLSSMAVYSQGRGMPRISLEKITVSGIVMTDSVAPNGMRYFLDTDNNGTKDYNLAFGPSWYMPTSGAVRPSAGQKVTVTGDLFKDITPPVIIVNELNGLKWRDSIGIRFIHNPVDRDSLRDKHNPMGNKFGWCVKDSLVKVSLSGKAIVDSIGTKHKNYFLDLQGDGGKDYILMFGPFWYAPKSGALRPENGASIAIEGGLIQKTDSANNTLNFVIVLKINGLAWIDSADKYPWPGGGIGKDHHPMTSIKSIYNSNTYCTFESMNFGMGHGMGMMPDNLYASIMEVDPVYLPVSYSGNIIAAYSINIMDDRMNGFLLPFDKNVKVNFNYTSNELAVAGVKNSQLKLKYIGENNLSIEIPTAKFDYVNKSVSFSQGIPSGIYVIESQQASALKVENNSVIPEKLSLEQNYPNPFNPSTQITFSIPKSGDVKLIIYSVIGNEVKTLTNNYYEAGTYNLNWDGKDNFGKKVASGIYLYKLQSGNSTLTKKMNMLK